MAAPNVCTVTGIVYNLKGEVVEGVSVQATLRSQVSYDGASMLGKTIENTRTDEFGEWEMDLVDNEGMRYFQSDNLGMPYYTFTFRGPGINLVENRIVRNVDTEEYLKLEFVQMEGDGEGFNKVRGWRIHQNCPWLGIWKGSSKGSWKCKYCFWQ